MTHAFIVNFGTPSAFLVHAEKSRAMLESIFEGKESDLLQAGNTMQCFINNDRCFLIQI